MDKALDRKIFAGFLGTTALLADIITIVQFIQSAGYSGFWSFQWIISLVFIVGLFAAGLALLCAATAPSIANVIIGIFGSAYSILAATVYLCWGVQQSNGRLTFGDYAGYGILFGIATATCAITIANISTKLLRFPSYAFGLVNIIFLFILLAKYVFAGQSFQWDHFIGEIVILGAGILLFVGLFTAE